MQLWESTLENVLTREYEGEGEKQRVENERKAFEMQGLEMVFPAAYHVH